MLQLLVDTPLHEVRRDTHVYTTSSTPPLLHSLVKKSTKSLPHVLNDIFTSFGLKVLPGFLPAHSLFATVRTHSQRS